MVKLIVGAAGSGKSRTVADMIKAEIVSGTRDIVLLVPEQQAVHWETRMSELLPVSANLRLEITNFTRLSNSVFREYGGLADTVVDEGTRALIMWRAMLGVSDSLIAFSPAAGEHAERAIPTLTRAVDELKLSGVTPADAERAVSELKDSADGDEKYSSLIARLTDAAYVYAAYNTILHGEYIDRGDLYDNLAAALAKYPYFRGKVVFVDSFFSLTAAEEKILSHIMRQADETVMTFACPAGERAASVQFAEITEQMKRIKALAVRENLPYTVIPLTENVRHSHSGELAAIEDRLFSPDAPEATPEQEKATVRSSDVHVIKCADRYDEAEACASVIMKLLHEGYRYSDIAVVAHDMGAYEGIADTVLRRHGIRCFMSETSDVSSSPAVRLVLAALAVAAGGWQRRDIIRLSKTGMTPASDNGGEEMPSLGLDLFEKYTYTWNIRGRRMYCADRWVMNPDGYRGEIGESGEKILALVNETKNRMIPPLDELLSVFGDGRGIASVREVAEKIVTFAEQYGVGASLEVMSANYREVGMEREAMHTAKSWDYVTEILDKMVSVLGDTPLTVTCFSGLFSLVASSMDKGTIPTGVDEVVLGSASGVRFDEVRCVIILGATEDGFPASVDDGGVFFDDRDRVALETVGLTLSSPDTATRLAREYFMFYRMAASAGEKLYILAPTGEGEKESSAVREIVDILALLGKSCTSVYGTMPLDEILYDKETALYLLSRRTDESELRLLRKIAGEKAGHAVSLSAGEERIVTGSDPVRRLSLSQSAIDRFVRCPFMYCCERRIKAKPDGRAELRLNDVGSFVHRVLERFFSETPEEKIMSGELTPEEIKETADGIITEYMDALAEAGGGRRGEYDGRIKYLITRLSRYVLVFIEAIARELGQSRFVPTAFELPIGMADEDGKTRAEQLRFTTESGCEVSLHGIADRVDIFDSPDGRKYVRIVDYKTGSKEFSLENLSRGTDIQLLIYLFSMWKLGLKSSDGTKEKLLPAGAVYFSVRPKIENAESLTAARENREKMIESVSESGVLLADTEILRAMEKELGGQFIPVTEKDGEPTSTQKNMFLVTSDGFGTLYTELESVLCGIGERMNAGCADAKPRKGSKGDSNPCDFCDYAYVCRRGEHN